MTFEERVEAVGFLGEWLRTYIQKTSSGHKVLLNSDEEKFFHLVEDEKNYNPWFTADNINYALTYWATHLTNTMLESWLAPYQSSIKETKSKTVGIIAAGNIPMVSLHDILSVFLCGHKVTVKLSSKDQHLTPFLFSILEKKEQDVCNSIDFRDGKWEKIDAVIATGSNNTNRYFETYFGKYPHLFRQHKSGVAILTGNESEKELEKLSDDIFLYFGLGCRNVCKIYVPQGYDFSPLLKAMQKWNHIFYHHSYINNYDYQKSMAIINKEPFIDNGFVILCESEKIFSSLGIIYYEYYSELCNLAPKFKAYSDQIQCIVSKNKVIEESVSFGESQQPQLWDYADNMDIINFLNHI